jgi:hypothetical protein
MFILAEDGNHYARARFNVGPGTDHRLRCRQDFSAEFPAADHEAWFAEYCENVHVQDPFTSRSGLAKKPLDNVWWEPWTSAADCLRDRMLEVGR